MLKLFVKLQTLMSSKKGQGMVEYGLILALIAIVVIGLLTGIGTKLVGVFTKVDTALPTP